MLPYCLGILSLTPKPVQIASRFARTCMSAPLSVRSSSLSPGKHPEREKGCAHIPRRRIENAAPCRMGNRNAKRESEFGLQTPFERRVYAYTRASKNTHTCVRQAHVDTYVGEREKEEDGAREARERELGGWGPKSFAFVGIRAEGRRGKSLLFDLSTQEATTRRKMPVPARSRARLQ